MNPIQLLALELMIDLAKDRKQRMTIAATQHMLMSIEPEVWANQTPAQRRKWIRNFIGTIKEETL